MGLDRGSGPESTLQLCGLLRLKWYKRGAVLREYVDTLRRLEPGQAGKVTANEGETTAGIRRRLATAADLLGKSLILNRQDNVVYFWEEGDGPSPVRRRRRSSAQSEE